MAVALLVDIDPQDRWFSRITADGRVITTRSPATATLYRNDTYNQELADDYAALRSLGVTVHICIIPLRESDDEELPWINPDDDEEDELTGDIVWSAAPTRANCLPADGAAVSRTTYSRLFAAIGTTYGAGDGSTTFNVPDLTGRVSIGKEAVATRITTAVSGFSGATLGASGGSQSHTLVIGEIPSHTHTIPLTTSNTVSSGSPNQRALSGSGLDTGAAGGGGAHRNVQPSIVLNAFVKL